MHGTIERKEIWFLKIEKKNKHDTIFKNLLSTPPKFKSYIYIICF